MIKIKLIQENPIVGDISGNLAKAKEEIVIAKKNNVNLIIFSEMFLCGYPPEDLVLRSDFIKEIDDSIEELIKEEYSGIRPAPGYPACPNHEEKDKIWEILDVEKEVGITLTESRAMYPTASVSGWYFSHPKSVYFSVLNN